MEAVPRAREAEFRSVLEPFDGLPGGTLCNMPSGGGYLAYHLRPDLRYIGVDPTSDFVTLGSKGEIHIIRAELSNVPLESGSVDYIVSLAGLHHEPDLICVFREMRRLARTGGRIVIADGARDMLLARFLNGFVDRMNPMGHEGRFLDEDTVALIEASGLTVLEDEIIDVPWVFGDVEEAASFASALFGTDRASASEILDALESNLGLSSGPWGVSLNWCLRRIICSAA